MAWILRCLRRCIESYADTRLSFNLYPGIDHEHEKVDCPLSVFAVAARRHRGSRPIYTSGDEPGLIYDTLAVKPASLKARRADWQKVVKTWDRIVAYVEDPKTQADAVKIMAARVGITPEAYLPLLKGTKLMTLAAGSKVFVKGEGFQSLHDSTKVADAFNVANAVYKKPENIDSYIDASLTNAK